MIILLEKVSTVYNSIVKIKAITYYELLWMVEIPDYIIK